jgi:hypothetical protein
VSTHVAHMAVCLTRRAVAALQCQVQYGNFNASMHKPGFLKCARVRACVTRLVCDGVYAFSCREKGLHQFLAEEFAKKKDVEARCVRFKSPYVHAKCSVFKEYRLLSGMSETKAKYRCACVGISLTEFVVVQLCAADSFSALIRHHVL